MFRLRKRVGRILVPLLAVAAAGCTNDATGNVTGTVRFNDQGQEKVLPESNVWTIAFVSTADGRQATATVQADGRYFADKVPTGPVKIAIVGITRGEKP